MNKQALREAIFNSPLRIPLWIARFFMAAIRERSGAFLRFHPGYHGSTIPSRKFIEANRERLFKPDYTFDGIDLNRTEQKEILDTLVKLYPDFNPPAHKTPGTLYHYANTMYGFHDGFVLYGMLRTFKPRRVIEVGSGFSSALMLDVHHQFLPESKFTFIDPYSTSIREVLSSKPQGNYEFLQKEIQNVDLEVFRTLEANDLLFIDTSHSVKIGSDVSTILFRIFPALKQGVIIHIHDVYFPWEYPEEFILEGRTYNEVYFLRAFLQYNSAFKIIFNSSQLELEYRASFPAGYFKSDSDRVGQSIWLRKIA